MQENNIGVRVANQMSLTKSKYIITGYVGSKPLVLLLMLTRSIKSLKDQSLQAISN